MGLRTEDPEEDGLTPHISFTHIYTRFF